MLGAGAGEPAQPPDQRGPSNLLAVWPAAATWNARCAARRPSGSVTCACPRLPG